MRRRLSGYRLVLSLLLLWAGGLLAAQAPAPATSVRMSTTMLPPVGGPTTKAVLTQADFTYIGSFRTPQDHGFEYAHGLTHRYVGGQLRLLSFEGGGPQGH